MQLIGLAVVLVLSLFVAPLAAGDLWSSTHQPSWTPGCALYRALATPTLARAREGLASNLLQRLPRGRRGVRR
jgi:hypothetical protein